MQTVFIIIGILLLAVIVVAGVYVYNNLNYYKAPLRKVLKVGFKEKQVKLKDGTVLNYAEGPDKGPALLLIHGQTVSWEDYARVLPKLSEYYHIYAVDCHGHGKSAKNLEKYSANVMGQDFVWFIENVIGEPAVVSGHSSGGLLTAWLAANSPENIKGIVLEDPPFFSCEAARTEKTFAYIDCFRNCHSFLNQSEENDFTLYYLKNCFWIKYFGNKKESTLKYAASYRDKHPNDRLEIFYLPPALNRIYWAVDSYDPKFGNTFYDSTWNKSFDHAEALSKINCPSVLIHASWSFDENEILMAAMSGDDAEKAHSIIKNSKLVDIVSGHDVHYEKPKEFIEIMVEFVNELV